MSTLIATATTAFIGALQASPAVCPVVERIRLRPQNQQVKAWLVVRPDGAMVADKLLNGQVLVWVCQLAVECNVTTSAATAAPDVAADALVASAYARLMSDTTLGGAVQHIDPVSLAYDFDADGEQTTCATFVFRVRMVAPAPSVF